MGDQGDCSPSNYVGGNWNGNYNRLVHAIAAYDKCMSGLNVKYTLQPSGLWIVTNNANSYIGNNAASIQARLIAQGGENLVSQGGANLIGSNGGTIYSLQGVQLISCMK